MLTFDAENHKYFWDKKEIPGVTEIIKKIGVTREYAGVDDFYRVRGTHVHKAIDLYLHGKLDEASLDPELIPYFNAFLSFEKKFKPKPIATEVKFVSRDKKWAGTIDFYGGIEI